MPYYKLVSSGRSDVIADEIILARDPVTNAVTKSVGSRIAEKLSEEEASLLRSAAHLIGYKVIELENEPDEETQNAARAVVASSSAGADVIGMAPAVEATGVSGATVDQAQTQAESENAESSVSGSTPGQTVGTGNQSPEGR